MLKIRNEKETDHKIVEEITRKAFSSIISFILCGDMRILYRSLILWRNLTGR